VALGGVTLGYLGFEVSDLAGWQKFGVDVLGMGVAHQDADGAFALRMDGHAQRIIVTSGGDDLGFIGWEAETEEQLDQVVARLAAAGHSVTEDPGLAVVRGVDRLYKCSDPAGIPTEICVGCKRSEEPFVSKSVPSGFVADELGLGHVVVTATNNTLSQRFYTELLGFVLSDRIVCEIYGHPVDLSFFHAPSKPGSAARHHSVAFGGQQRHRLHHFMIEAASLEDVGRAYDRAIAKGVPIMQTLGRHPNDQMLSFYAQTPSGFQFEFGWGGRLVDDTDWVPTTYGRISDWGHHPPAILNSRRSRRSGGDHG